MNKYQNNMIQHPTYKVANAVKNGELIKENCSVCGSIKNVIGHHEDYNKPLDVIWLCKKCHGKRHYEIKTKNHEQYEKQKKIYYSNNLNIRANKELNVFWDLFVKHARENGYFVNSLLKIMLREFLTGRKVA